MELLSSIWTVRSAGINPAGEVHPLARLVMKEAGMDIDGARPKSVDLFLEEPWDYVIRYAAMRKRPARHSPEAKR